jgi:hypothetical protein
MMITLAFLFGLLTLSVCQGQQLPPEWIFDDEDDIMNWGGMNQLLPLELDEVKDKKGETRTILRTVSTGSDPYVFPDGGWNGFIGDIDPFDGGEYDTIYIGVRANVTSSWQIYYISDEDGTYTEAQRQNFPVSESDDFEDLEFVMVEGGWQDRMITGFRLDPGTLAGVEAEIDYLSLRGIPEDVAPKAVEYTRKLAVTWGDIRGEGDGNRQ